MRIGLVLPEAPQYSETFFNFKIKNLEEAGAEVIVFSNKKENRNSEYKIKSAYPVFENHNIKQFIYTVAVLTRSFITNYRRTMNLYNLEKTSGNTISGSLKSVYINAHILTEKIDCLHFGYTTMALKRENVAMAIGSKMSISFRGYDINVYPLKHPGCYNKIWNRVDKVHSISDYLYKKAVRLGLPTEIPFEKITPAIDISFFKFKSDSGKLKNKINILTIGRLNWIKDYETAISTMSILKERGIEFIYNIIGSGTEAERLTFCVYQMGLQENIIFHGKKDQIEIAGMMMEADIYIQTSLQEGFCVSVLEAQATGLLCIVSDADGLKENVINNRTGWIAERRNPKDFADKIEMVKNMSEKKRAEIVKSARERVKEEFSMEDQKKKFYNFFKE